MSKLSRPQATLTGRRGDAFARMRDFSSESPTTTTTDEQSNVATQSVASSNRAQQPGANTTPTPIDYSRLIVKELKSILRDRGLQVSGTKAVLVQRLEEYDALNQVGARGLGHDIVPVGTQWKEQKWIDSFAKAYLKKCLLDDKSKIHSMTPAEVYLSHPSFACYPKDRFIANLANLKQALRIERALVVQEEEEFAREKSLYPRGKVTSRGSGIDNVTITREGQSRELKQWLGRAKNRQESLHSRIKSFNILKQRFRHGRKGTDDKLDLHRTCVEAVCVLVQYDMDCGNPVFDL